MGDRDSVGIGLMGLGVVGGGVARALLGKAQAISAQVGCPLRLARVLEKDQARVQASAMEPALFTTDATDIFTDPQIDIVVECLGGERPAYDFIKEALGRGKYVVTSNKEVVAKHGPEFHALAQERGVDILYEASVGGGIPLVAPFKRDLLANRISAIYAIINGTTNYILTRMAQEGIEFSAALTQAQELGYAEPDPTNDIEGIDAVYKLAILCALAFNARVHPDDIYREGISRLSARDFRYARELGYEIKLLAIAKESEGQVEARVHPVFLPRDLLLAKVDGVYNAVQVEGDLVGRVLFYGQGAGPAPTASAILSDVIDIAKGMRRGGGAPSHYRLDPAKRVRPIAEVETRYYVRMHTADRAGVLAQISRVFAELGISISSVIQRETDVASQTAQIVLMTYPAQESAVQRALAEIERLDVVNEVANFVRVED